MSGVSTSTKARKVTQAGFVFTHSSFWTRVVFTIGFLFLAVYSTKSVFALATITLGKINTRTAVETWLRSTFINVDFATFSRKSCWAETLNSVAEWYAKSAVQTRTFGAHDRLAFISSCCSYAFGFCICWTFQTNGLSTCCLVKVSRTWRAWC